ncbi:uncharacterized protein PRCAT00000644001 [Priceomyces carsonii]|uniref:uncharacterized protein n=1 Tax=Priceomyces carsonii TaxID=28549 RepID=UPI002EDB940B|nr:unnamed protein product [Priceomyces carsonii]
MESPSSDFIQQRINQNAGINVLCESSLESFLLPDNESESIQWKLLDICGHSLPDRSYAMELINTVYNIYCIEYYLIDMNELLPLVDEIYDIFDYNGRDSLSIRYHDLSKRVNHKSLCYFFIILAFGEQLQNRLPVSKNRRQLEVERLIPGIEYYILASQLFHLTREELDYEFIQSAILLAFYSANLNRYNTVYNYIGVAIRSVLAKGYHRQRLGNTMMSEEEVVGIKKDIEKLKRLFWTVFVIETAWGVNRMSLPVHINYVDTDVDLPNENAYDLGDPFNSEMLEVNVHLAKYVSKYLRLIYGPHIRTFSINYINTDQFNKKLLIKNIVECLHNLINDFEQPFLTRYNSKNFIQTDGRALANLFVRYHQLIISITKPLLTVVFNKNSLSLIENPQVVHAAISKGISAACWTVEILLKLHECGKLFIMGFWDSQHLFSALIMIILSSLSGNRYSPLDRGVALLKYMADQNNVNAQNGMKKLKQINEFLKTTPDVDLVLDLDSKIEHFVQADPRDYGKSKNIHTRMSSAIFMTDQRKNKSSQSSHRNPMRATEPLLINIDPEPKLFTNDGIEKFSDYSQDLLDSMINTIQSWDNAVVSKS